MRIIFAQSTAEAQGIVASMLLEKLELLKNPVIGLATGRTMEPVYKILTEKILSRPIKLKSSTFFMLDEYVGLSPGHSGSFKTYIDTHIRKPLSLPEDQFVFPDVHNVSLTQAALSYERSIQECSGIDLQLLGVGQNGHIGFNEPGSSKTSRTRVVKLTDETLKANKSAFKNGDIPSEALSMGVGTIMEARELVMLATGDSKAQVIKYLVNHHDDDSCPVTYLKSHPHFVLVLDPDAASKINLKI